MINRFKRYLEREFRAIAPTQEAMDYREEVLGTLLDRAQEYRIKGMTDEDMIYDMCIDGLGDFRATLVDFENKREQLKKKALGVGAGVLGVFAAAFIITIGYLVISFVTRAWAKTWVLEVSGIFVLVISGLIIILPKLIRSKKFLVIRALTMVAETLVIVAVYLNLLVWTRLPNTWYAFISLPIVLLLVDTIIAYLTKSKTALVALLALIMTASTLSYVMLCLSGLLAWGIYWLIPVFGAVVDICILAVAIVTYLNKKKNGVKQSPEDLYTTWKN